MTSQWYPLRVAVLRDELRDARAELVELRTERDALQAACDELQAERDDWRARALFYAERVMLHDGVTCANCGENTDLAWVEESGGLCGDCLAGYSVPLTRITQRPPT